MNEKWEYRTIGDVCIVERGGSPRPIDSYITDDPNGVNWIKIGDTSDSMYITETAQKIIREGMKKSRYVQPGDFLLSNSMSFGRPYILKIDGCIHDGWLVLRDKDEIFDKRFLYYYLSAKPTYEQFKMMAVGGVVNNLNSDMVRKVSVPIPTIVEQKEIADLLDKANNIINSRKHELQSLDNLIKARFVEMFGSISDYVNIIEIAHTYIGLVTTMTTHYCDSGTPLLFNSSIKADKIVWDGTYLDSEFAEANKSRMHKTNDIITVHTGDIGTSAVIGEELNNSLGFATIVTRINDRNKYNPIFISSFLNYGSGKEQLSKYSRDVRNNLNLKDFNRLMVPNASISAQNKYADFVKQLDKSKFAVQKALDEAQLLFDSLMQKYFG